MKIIQECDTQCAREYLTEWQTFMNNIDRKAVNQQFLLSLGQDFWNSLRGKSALCFEGVVDLSSGKVGVEFSFEVEVSNLDYQETVKLETQYNTYEVGPHELVKVYNWVIADQEAIMDAKRQTAWKEGVIDTIRDYVNWNFSDELCKIAFKEE